MKEESRNSVHKAVLKIPISGFIIRWSSLLAVFDDSFHPVTDSFVNGGQIDVVEIR